MKILNCSFVRKKQYIFIILFVVIVFLCATALLFTNVFPTNIVSDDNYSIHKYAVEIPVEQDNFSILDTPEKGGGAVVSCGTDAEVYLKDKVVDYYYSNPSRSPSAVTLELFADDKLIATSGLIPPGYRTFQLNSVKKINLKEGTYKGILKIHFYNSETNQKTDVNGEVEVLVTVIK